MRKRYFAIYFYCGDPQAADVFYDSSDMDYVERAGHELHSCEEGWNRVDLYDVTCLDCEDSDVSLDNAGQCVASIERENLHRVEKPVESISKIEKAIAAYDLVVRRMSLLCIECDHVDYLHRYDRSWQYRKDYACFSLLERYQGVFPRVADVYHKTLGF